MIEAPSNPPTFRGSCLCGEVRYSIAGLPIYAVYCHCSECRKFSGSPFSASLGVGVAQLTIDKCDDATIGRFEKTPTTHLRFCSRCGSSIYVEKIDHGLVHIRMGTLDIAPSVEFNAHIHTDSKAAWDTLPEDGLPRFPTSPPANLISELVRRAATGL